MHRVIFYNNIKRFKTSSLYMKTVLTFILMSLFDFIYMCFPDSLKEWLRCFQDLLGFALGILYKYSLSHL